MLRKFYAPDGEENAGGSDEPIVAELKDNNAPKFKVGEAFSSDELGQEPEDIVKERPDEEDEVVNKVEKAEEKADDKKEENKEEVKTPVNQDWKEFVKNPQYRKEVFQLLDIDEDSLNLSKDLKSDEFVKKMVTYRKEHGNLTPFVTAATMDYDKISTEQLIMDDLQKQYSHLPSDKAAKLAKSDFNQRFVYKDDLNLDETENAELAELTAIKLESEGLKLRAKLKADQQTFLDSVKPVDRTAEAQRIADEQKAKDKLEQEKFIAMYDAANAKFNAEKKLVLGKENPFNYTVEPASIKEQTLDTNKFYGKFWSEKDGREVFDTVRWNKVIAYSNDPEAFEEALINHGMSLEGKKIDDELENAKVKTDKSTPLRKESLAKAVVKGQSFSFNGA